MTLLCPHPPRPPLPCSLMYTGESVLDWFSHVQRCIGSLNPTWQTFPNSTRLTYLGVYDIRDGASVPVFPVPPLLAHACTQVYRFSQPYLADCEVHGGNLCCRWIQWSSVFLWLCLTCSVSEQRRREPGDRGVKMSPSNYDESGMLWVNKQTPLGMDWVWF